MYPPGLTDASKCQQEAGHRQNEKKGADRAVQQQAPMIEPVLLDGYKSHLDVEIAHLSQRIGEP